ncbi:glycosyltransferase family 2 protein [Mucilaginibacter sp. SJ]|uniref:glycosyltransferase family 2 protein n=1 Tax=Mucilaginibacter sp. SJ TaxID=3029053 RepID=UPI0023A9ACB1|nr:glycosyltransferase family 2 protein [Mucilaginibacter sp. SJ]WEA02320.1 glycosyltransferase family 2 protein [Mucilaginibacter sp. SJ]
MNKPLVTVITSSFNSASTIEQTICSVINQTYTNIEYIVIDGGSTDGTVEILRKYDKNITYWVSEPDKGIYNAWNKGLKSAKGDWISFLGADDIYLNNAIENYVTYINYNQQKAEFDFVSSVMEYVDKDLNVLRLVGKPWYWRGFNDTMVTIHCGALHNRNFFEKYGCFDESYRSAGDYALLLKAGQNLKSGFINTITVKMREGGVSSKGLFLFKEVLKAKRDSKHVPMLKAYIRFYVGIMMFFLRKTRGYLSK